MCITLQVSLLISALTPDSSFDDLDHDFDRLFHARDQTRLLGQMEDSKIVALATYASQRLQSEIQEGLIEVEETLKVSLAAAKANSSQQYPKDRSATSGSSA
jgi:hypothetical protein